MRYGCVQEVHMLTFTVFDLGFKCQLFVMDLLYYKLYRLTMLEQFYLPRDLYDIHALIPCLRRMDALEVCVIYVSFLFIHY